MSKTTRILFVRLSAIGDIIMASGVVASFNANPDNQLFWLVDEPIAGLIEQPDNVTTLTVPFSRWRGMLKKHQYFAVLKDVIAFRKRLHALNFDIAIDSQGILKSGILTWLSGAKRRIGLGSSEGSQYLMTEVIAKPKNDYLMSTEYRFLTEQLDFAPGLFAHQLLIADRHYHNARARLTEAGLSEQGYTVLCPFTTRPQKHWFNQHWQHLVDRIVQNDPNHTIIILGGPADSDAAATLMEGMPSQVQNWVGQTNLAESVALVSLAHYVVGVDTGLTHAGMISAAKTIGIFGSTQPYLHSPSSNSKIVCLRLSCSPCRRKPTCGGRFDCMKEINADIIYDELRSLI